MKKCRLKRIRAIHTINEKSDLGETLVAFSSDRWVVVGLVFVLT